MTDKKTKRGPGRPKGATKARMQRRARYQKKLKADKEKLKQEQAVLEGEVMPVVKRPVGKPKGHPKTGGRVKGVETLDKRALREQVARVVEMKSKSIGVWIDEVYKRNGPDKALDKVIALLEYAVPKLNRTEYSGVDGGPVEHEVNIVINAIKPVDDL